MTAGRKGWYDESMDTPEENLQPKKYVGLHVTPMHTYTEEELKSLKDIPLPSDAQWFYASLPFDAHEKGTRA